MRRFLVGLLVLVSALSLLLASTSLWTRRHIVDTDVFVGSVQRILADPTVSGTAQAKIVDTVMAQPAVTGAIDDAVSVLPPRLQQFEPAITDGARSLLAQGVGLVLTSPQFATVTSAAVRDAHDQLIAGQPVRFTLGQAKDLVPPDSRNGLAWQVLSLLPSDAGVTVLTPADAPGLYSALDLLKVVWLWLGLLALGLLVGALLVSRTPKRTLRAWAVTTGVLCLVLVVVLRALRGPLLGQVQPANVAAADVLYQGVTASLRSWTLWLVAIMAAIVVVTLLWGRIGIVPAVRRGAASARAAAVRRREQRTAVAGPGEPVPSWGRRVADGTRSFVDGLGLPERLARLAAFLRRNLRMVRWAGVAVGAVVLLFWPDVSLQVVIWVAAAVALYLGLVELVLATSPAPATSADPVAPVAAVAAVPEPRDGANGVAPTPLPAEVEAMGGKLDLLIRLGDARAAGVLTDEEFAREKSHLLGR